MENQDRFQRKASDVVFTKRIKAGRRRTYFFDVRATRGNDYYLTITESKKRPDDTYEKHKIFLYKEDFNKFMAGLSDAVTHVKTELMPDFDFTQFDREDNGDYNNSNYNAGFNQQSYDNAPVADVTTPVESVDDFNAVQPRNESNDYNTDTAPSDDDLKW